MKRLELEEPSELGLNVSLQVFTFVAWPKSSPLFLLICLFRASFMQCE